MTDSIQVVEADGPTPPSSYPPKAERMPIGGILTTENISRALPFVLVPLLYILSLFFIHGYFSKASIISLLILGSLLGLSSLGRP